MGGGHGVMIETPHEHELWDLLPIWVAQHTLHPGLCTATMSPVLKASSLKSYYTHSMIMNSRCMSMNLIDKTS